MIVEVETDGRTIWVNASDGMCIGRFGPMGIDVHHSAAEQLRTGKACQVCSQGRPGLTGWERFKNAMLEHHSVIVDDSLLPEWLKGELH